MRRIVLVTDAWAPQVNGVVTTLEQVTTRLRARGCEVEVINPQDFRTLPCPTYPSIRLALLPGRALARRLQACAPDAVHIATEGPLGIAARACCLAQAWPFTTSFHTQFPEYVRARAPIPLAWSYAWLRRFHGAAARTLVATQSVAERLAARGFTRLARWTRGVDTTLFRPRGKAAFDLPRPIALYVGRVAVEKNIEAFLDVAFRGSKVVIGDGPDLARLRARHPGVTFTGQLRGEALAMRVSAADVFVFPSRTDTFGLVMLEAMAAGLPVAAFPVQGPIDVVAPGLSGVLDDDLGRAIEGALRLAPADCIAHASRYSWDATTEVFHAALAPIAQA
ncbi:MAG: glycosyltransferase family 4 protein [Gammaproteobacteria bacterium]